MKTRLRFVFPNLNGIKNNKSLLLCGIIAALVAANLARSFSVITTTSQTESFTEHPRPPPPPPPPRLILHVGPPKTATTTIQCSLSKLEEMGRLAEHHILLVERQACRPDDAKAAARLEQYQSDFPHASMDEFEFQVANNNTATVKKALKAIELTSYKRVVKGKSWFPGCIKTWDWSKQVLNQSIPDCWTKTYLDYIHNYYHYKKMTTFVISNENLANIISKQRELERPAACADRLEDMLASLGKDFEMDIVFTHRYMYDLYISYYGERYGVDKMGRPNLIIWPNSGTGRVKGKALPTMVAHFTEQPLPIRLLPVFQCLKAASDRHPKRIHLKVFDFHDNTTDLVATFIENVLPTSMSKNKRHAVVDQWTQELSNDSSIHANEAKRYHYGYDRMAVAAYQAGWVSNITMRPVVSDAIRTFCNARGIEWKELPHVCPSDDNDNANASFYERVRKESWALQEAVAPFLDPPNNEDSGYLGRLRVRFQNHFQQSIDALKFCDVDGKAALMEFSPHLRLFLNRRFAAGRNQSQSMQLELEKP